MEVREAADVVNDFGRDPIGEGKEEQVCSISLNISHSMLTSDLQKYNRELKSLLDDRRDDAAPTAEMGELGKDALGHDIGGKRSRVKLEDLTRFTMVKRIW